MIRIININFNTLEMNFFVPENLRGIGIVESAFKKAIELWKPFFVRGIWKVDPVKYKDTGGASLNYTIYKDAVNNQNMKPEDAVFETITGKWAKRNGYDGIPKIEEDSDKEVRVLFIKK